MHYTLINFVHTTEWNWAEFLKCKQVHHRRDTALTTRLCLEFTTGTIMSQIFAMRILLWSTLSSNRFRRSPSRKDTRMLMPYPSISSWTLLELTHIEMRTTQLTLLSGFCNCTSPVQPIIRKNSTKFPAIFWINSPRGSSHLKISNNVIQKSNGYLRVDHFSQLLLKVFLLPQSFRPSI